VVTGSAVAPYYDSLLAKLVVWDSTRAECITRSVRVLDETRIDGVKTTLPLLAALLRRPELLAVDHHSTFIETTPDLMGALA
jgi:acetyl-CoA carboxylase biotin carboxylase subunit